MTTADPATTSPHAPSSATAGREPLAPGERRINLLILASSLWIGGAETVIRHLAQTIDRRRFNLTVCCLKQRGSIGDELVRAGIEVISFEETKPEKIDYLTFRKLLRLIRSRNIEVVHTHTAHGLVDTGLCRAFRPSLKLVHTFHFGNYPHTSTSILRMERVFSRLATRLYAVGEVQRAQVRAVYKFLDRSIGTVWNGVHVPPETQDRSFRNQVGNGDRLLVGTIGTLIEQKGMRDVFRVARRIIDAGRQVHFVIVGEGVLRGELEAMRRDMGLEAHVTMTGWVTSAADVALPAFDVFFQPSLWEAMSVVTLEAMAAGKPVVVTRVGEAPHVIEDGVDGLLVPPKDVDAMEKALLRIIDDPAYRTAVGAAARRKIQSQLTVDHMTRAYERIYQDVLR
ncbi:MAG: glycosyltransferase family 4 protein [Vicinamibacteraceae bacterium]